MRMQLVPAEEHSVIRTRGASSLLQLLSNRQLVCSVPDHECTVADWDHVELVSAAIVGTFGVVHFPITIMTDIEDLCSHPFAPESRQASTRAVKGPMVRSFAPLAIFAIAVELAIAIMAGVHRLATLDIFEAVKEVVRRALEGCLAVGGFQLPLEVLRTVLAELAHGRLISVQVQEQFWVCLVSQVEELLRHVVQLPEVHVMTVVVLAVETGAVVAAVQPLLSMQTVLKFDVWDVVPLEVKDPLTSPVRILKAVRTCIPITRGVHATVT